jgi:ABC-type transporter Mla MlaB component
MEVHMTGTTVHLEGDWTQAGVTQSAIDSMAVSLEQMGSGCEKSQRIDCGQIINADASGLQFLYTWLQCFRFRGVEPELINIPENMRKMFLNIGFRNCCS